MPKLPQNSALLTFTGAIFERTSKILGPKGSEEAAKHLLHFFTLNSLKIAEKDLRRLKNYEYDLSTAAVEGSASLGKLSGRMKINSPTVGVLLSLADFAYIY